MAKILIWLLLVLACLPLVHADTVTTPDMLIGWHERLEVTELSTGYLNDSGLGVAQIFLFEIKSGEVSEILVDTDTYSVEINITEPSAITTQMTINTTNFTGASTETTHTFYHVKVGPLSTPIYVLIGTPPVEWGVHSNGVVGKTYSELNLGTITGLAALDMPAAFAYGWDTYYDGWLNPPGQFYITSDGPITVRYEVQTLSDIYERRDRSLATYALSFIAKIPYIGKPLALSIEAIGTIMAAFVALIFFVITGWAILFLLFETFVLAHGVAVMKSTGGGIAGIFGVFAVIATDNYVMFSFVVDIITKMFTLLIDSVKTIIDAIPFL